MKSEFEEIMKVKLRLSEKSSYPYVYFDSKNKLHVFVPLAGGSEVGIDNTCKATREIKDFFVGNDAERNKHILRVIKDYIDTLDQDIEFLTKYSLSTKEIKKKEERKVQLEQCHKLLSEIITPALISSFSGGFPEFPSPIINALKAEDTNCTSVKLSPNNPDNYLRFHHHIFSLNRTYKNNSFRVFFNTEVASCFQTNKNKICDPKQALINEVVASFKKQQILNNDELNELKAAIVQVFDAHGINIIKETLDTNNAGDKSDFDYFVNITLRVDTNSRIEEWVDSIISNSIAEAVFTNYKSSSPFQMKDSANAEEKFSIKIQLFLALLNVYNFEITGDRKDFGQILESQRALLDGFFEFVKQGITNNFLIENAIIEFMNEFCVAVCEPLSFKASQCFFPTKLSSDQIIELKSQFNRIWQTIKESPHFDEFLFIMPKKKGDFYIHQSRICLDFARYIKEFDINLYNKYFNSGLLTHDIDPQVPLVSQLPSNNVDMVQIDLTVTDILKLDAKSIARALISETDTGKKLYESLEESTVESIKIRDDWKFIFSDVIKSDISQETINQFTGIFGVPNCYILDLLALQALYTEISLTYAEDPHRNPLSSLTGWQKLTRALEALDIPFSAIEFNDRGDFIITLKQGANFTHISERLRKFELSNKNRLHITSPMSPAYYQAAEALSTPTLNIRAELSGLNNAVPDPRQSKMARTLQYILNINPINIVSFDKKPGRNQIHIEYYHSNGYLVTGNPELMNNLRQSYYNRLTLNFDENQINELIYNAGLIPEVTQNKKETIIVALDTLKIDFFGVRKIGNNWMIILELEKGKAELEKICSKSNVQMRKLLAENAKLKQKAADVAMEFGIKLISVKDHNDKQPINSFTYELKNAKEKSFLINVINQISKNAIIRQTDKPSFLIEVKADFITSLNLGELLSMAYTHPLIQESILDQAKQFAKSLGCELTYTRSNDIINNPSHNARQPIEFFEFMLDFHSSLHREVVKYLTAQPGSSFLRDNNRVILKVRADFFPKNDAEKILQRCLESINLHKKIIFKSPTTSPQVNEKLKNYQVLLSEETLDFIMAYKNDLRLKKKQPGAYFSERLQKVKDLNELTIEEFIDILFQTKLPCIFAESQVYGNGLDWTPDELTILGSLSVAVATKIYDDGKHYSPDIHPEPFMGNLIFTPGALLRNDLCKTTPDMAAVIKQGQLNESAFYKLYETRLLPILLHINQIMQQKQTESSHPKAFITIPGLGCGQFAGDFKLQEPLKKVLIELLTQYGQKLPYIKAVYYDPFTECNNDRQAINGIEFFCRPLTKGNENKPQLCPPSHYEGIPGEFSNCELFSLVAWDHVSWVTNDLIRGGRITDDGVKGSATDTLTMVTGYPGSYDTSNLHLPKYSPQGDYVNWEQCIIEQGLSFGAKNRLYVAKHGMMLQLTGNDVPNRYHLSPRMIEKLISAGDSRNKELLGATGNPAALAQLLQDHGCNVINVTPRSSNGFDVVLKKEDFDKIVSKVGCPFHLSSDIELLIYREVNLKQCGNAIANMTNVLDNGIKASKIKLSLKFMGIDFQEEDLDYHVENNKYSLNGYDLLIKPDEIDKILIFVKKFNQHELPTIKKDVISKLNLFSTISYLGAKNGRILALVKAVEQATSLMDITDLLRNQRDLVTGASSITVVNDSVCAKKWTTTKELLPHNSQLFKATLSELLESAMNPRNVSQQLLHSPIAPIAKQP